jgi:hypothetical protein
VRLRWPAHGAERVRERAVAAGRVG